MTSLSRIPARTMTWDALSATLGPLVSSKLNAVLRLLPSLTKYLLGLLLLLNVRSLPFGWHFRVFRPVFAIRLRYILLRLRVMFSSRAVQNWEEDRWLDSISPIGAHPLKMLVSYNTWASIDDSDFNGHLSNSSYGKTLDSARFKTALAMFPQFFRAGGWMPLAATHYNFVREIPMLAKYEVRVTIGAWDQKWLYVVSKFVTKPKGKKPQKKAVEPEESTPTSSTIFSASVRQPADEVSNTGTPLSDTEASRDDTSDALKAVAVGLLPSEEPDGATLHTISVSQVCFKIGRITVPPALVLACNGFSAPPLATAANGFASASLGTYSPANPPPHWVRAKAVMSKPVGGSTKALQALFKGGWRDVPEGERWWDQALGGVEEQRKANLELLEGLRKGMDGARGLN